MGDRTTTIANQFPNPGQLSYIKLNRLVQITHGDKRGVWADGISCEPFPHVGAQ